MMDIDLLVPVEPQDYGDGEHEHRVICLGLNHDRDATPLCHTQLDRITVDDLRIRFEEAVVETEEKRGWLDCMDAIGLCSTCTAALSFLGRVLDAYREYEGRWD